MRRWALAGGWLLAVGSLTACAAEEDSPPPTLSDFCAAVERAPQDDTSIVRTRAAAADVEQNAPPEIRAEITTLREALATVHTAKDLEEFAEQGGPVQAASRRYHEYIELNCFD